MGEPNKPIDHEAERAAANVRDTEALGRFLGTVLGGKPMSDCRVDRPSPKKGIKLGPRRK